MTPAEYTDRVNAVLRRLTPEERAAVRAELDGHIEDHMEALRQLGYDGDLAQERTMAAMGDPEEVGRALEKQYPLGWLYLGRAAVVVSIIICMQMVLGIGVLGMIFDSITARIHPDETTSLHTVAAEERVNIRVPVGNDVLRIYRVSVGQTGDQLGLWEAEVSMCAYDRFPGGIVSNHIWSHIRVENPRGEAGTHSGGRGSWWAEYTQLFAPLEPGDTTVTVTYEYLGQFVSLELPLPDGGVPS